MALCVIKRIEIRAKEREQLPRVVDAAAFGHKSGATNGITILRDNAQHGSENYK